MKLATYFLFAATCVSVALGQSSIPNCSFEPWPSTGGLATLTICSNPTMCSSGNIATASAAGRVSLVGFNVPYTCNTSQIEYLVKTADVSTTVVHHYALGLVCQSGGCTPGALYVQTGSIVNGPAKTSFTPSGMNAVTRPWLPATGCTALPCTLTPGVYALAIGSDCTSSCAVLFGDADMGSIYAFDTPNTSLDTPWAFDPVNGLPQNFSNMPAIQPTTLSTSTGLVRPPTVLIY